MKKKHLKKRAFFAGIYGDTIDILPFYDDSTMCQSGTKAVKQ